MVLLDVRCWAGRGSSDNLQLWSNTHDATHCKSPNETLAGCRLRHAPMRVVRLGSLDGSVETADTRRERYLVIDHFLALTGLVPTPCAGTRQCARPSGPDAGAHDGKMCSFRTVLRFFALDFGARITTHVAPWSMRRTAHTHTTHQDRSHRKPLIGRLAHTHTQIHAHLHDFPCIRYPWPPQRPQSRQVCCGCAAAGTRCRSPHEHSASSPPILGHPSESRRPGRRYMMPWRNCGAPPS